MGLLDQYQIGGPSLFGSVDTPFGGQPAKRGGFLGSGYDGEDIMSMMLRAAAIAQGDLGAGAKFGANIGAKARAEAEAAQQEAAWRARKQWEWDNAPKESNLTEYGRALVEQGLQPGTPEFIEAMKQYNTRRADPTVTTTLPGNRFYSGPASALPQALGGVTGNQPASSPPPEAIAELKSNPSTAGHFDEVFGQGAAARYLGGGASNGTGGFPY